MTSLAKAVSVAAGTMHADVRVKSLSTAALRRQFCCYVESTVQCNVGLKRLRPHVQQRPENATRPPPGSKHAHGGHAYTNQLYVFTKLLSVTSLHPTCSHSSHGDKLELQAKQVFIPLASSKP